MAELPETIPLYMFEQEQMWEVAQRCKPDITREEFQRMWDDWKRDRDLRQLRGTLQ